MEDRHTSKRRRRTRAGIVCVVCHARKVKCDLQQTPGGTCSNCQRLGHQCRPRISERPVAQEPFQLTKKLSLISQGRGWTRTHGFSTAAPASCRASAEHNGDTAGTTTNNGNDNSNDSDNDEGNVSPNPYNAADLRESIMPGASHRPLATSYQSLVSHTIQAQYIELCGALILPPPLMQDALRDNYFEHVYRRCAVIDRAHLQQSPQQSVTLTQAVCLVGASMRQAGPEYLATCEHLYIKVKTLLMANHEKNLRCLLQALCMMSCWNLTPMQIVSCECYYHWFSTVIRLLFQAGLHREETYAIVKEPGVLRRIAWYAYAMDKVYCSGLGFPCMIRPDEFHVRPLEAEDFESFDENSQIFIHFITVNSFRARMLQVYRRKGESDVALKPVALETMWPGILKLTRGTREKGNLQTAYDILRSMQAWIRQVITQFPLYIDEDTSKRRYNLAIYELYISYFAVITSFFHLCGRVVHITVAHPAALVASSCTARLYEEILYREELGYFLPVHNWYISIMCMVQINALARGGGRHADAARQFPSAEEEVVDEEEEEELNILRRALRVMGVKWPQANDLRAQVDRLYKNMVAVVGTTGNPTADTGTSSAAAEELGAADFAFQDVDNGSALNDLLRELFPFPQSMCPRMHILDSMDPVTPGHQADDGRHTRETLTPAGLWSEDYYLNWPLDSFGFNSLRGGMEDLDSASLPAPGSSSLAC